MFVSRILHANFKKKQKNRHATKEGQMEPECMCFCVVCCSLLLVCMYVHVGVWMFHEIGAVE